LDREIITKLKDGLYDIELENDEVASSIIRSRQEWSSAEYDTLLFKKVVEREYRVTRLYIKLSTASAHHSCYAAPGFSVNSRFSNG
jgi:hypothetical protein